MERRGRRLLKRGEMMRTSQTKTRIQEKKFRFEEKKMYRRPSDVRHVSDVRHRWCRRGSSLYRDLRKRRASVQVRTSDMTDVRTLTDLRQKAFRDDPGSTETCQKGRTSDPFWTTDI